MVGKTPYTTEYLEKPGKATYVLKLAGHVDKKVTVATDKTVTTRARLTSICAKQREEADPSQPSLVNPYDPCREK
jgi:hypothetical protein